MKLTSYPGHFSFHISDGGEGVSYQRGEMPWGRDCHQLHEVCAKQALHKV